MASFNSHDRINDRLSPVNKKKGGKGLFLGGCAALAVVVLAVVSISVMGKPKLSEPADTQSKNIVVTPENVDEVIEELEDKKVAIGTYNVKMNPTWTFDDGEATSTDAYVENSAVNNNDVRFTVEQKDTEELIYSSPIIPLGSRLENIALDKVLPAGSYECIITYHLLDDNGEDSSSVKLNLNIVVNN